MGLFNLILGAILITLSSLGYIFKPFAYWWIVSIIALLIAIVLIWIGLISTEGPAQ